MDSRADDFTMPPSVVSTPDSSVAGQQAEVTGEKVTIRSGPSVNFDPITSLSKGDNVTLLKIEDGWYNIRTASGRTGWVAGYLVNVLPASRLPVRGKDAKTVIGYYLLGDQSYQSMLANSKTLTHIAPWSWHIDSYGNLTSDFSDAQFAEVLQYAGNSQLGTLALIHNFGSSTFDSRTISNLLNNTVAQERAINQIHRTLKEWEMKGVNIDFENVPAKDRQVLTNFMAKLSEKLHEDGMEVTIAVPAKTQDNLNNDFSGAYDYENLAKHVDSIVIMAYDQHYRLGSPGPVASVKWVEDVVKFAVSQAPGSKIVLGMPAYGYNWPSSGPGKGVTYQQAMETAAKEGVSVKWHSEHRVPFFEYGGNQVWFENRYSIRYKVDLVKKYDLAGMALWRLGQEDPGIWKTINDAL